MDHFAVTLGGLVLVFLLRSCVSFGLNGPPPPPFNISSVEPLDKNNNGTGGTGSSGTRNRTLEPVELPAEEAAGGIRNHTDKQPAKSLWSCKDRCQYTSETFQPQSCVSCHCDPLCVMAGDCCVDYFPLCHNLSRPDLTTRRIRQLLLLQDPPSPSPPPTPTPGPAHHLPAHLLARYGQCAPSGWKPFLAVSACPARFPDLATRSRCDNSSALLAPVTHLHHPTLVFRNVFCAQCHGFPPNVTRKWDLTLKCKGLKSENSTVLDIIKAFKQNRCSQVYQPPEPENKTEGSFETTPRLCYPPLSEDDQKNLQSRLNDSFDNGICTKDDGLFCLTYNLPAKSNATVRQCAKNSYCLKCGVNDSILFIPNSCGPCPVSNDDLEQGSKLELAGISKLFHFSSDGTQVTINGQTVPWPGFYCGTDEVYDHHDRVCRKLTCSAGYQLKDWQCVPVSLLVEGHTQLLANGSRFFSILLQFAEEVSEKSMMKLEKDIVDRLTESHRTPPPTVVLVFHSSNNHTAQVSMNVTGSFNFRDEYKNIAGLHSRISARYHKVTNITVSNVGEGLDDVTTPCPDGALPLIFTNLNVTEKRRELFVVVASRRGGQQLYPLNHIPFTMTLDFSEGDEENVPTVTNAVLCQQNISNSSLTCPALEHLRNETSIVNGSLVLLSSGLVFGEEEYEVDGDKVRVCSRYENRNSLWDKLIFFNFDPAQVKVMYVLSAVSVLSLVFVLCIYCLLPDLRTLPGKLVMSVVVSLLAGHVTLMINVEDDTACGVLAVLSHFVWLACFTWMSAIALHMASTFTCMAAASSVTSAAEARRTWVTRCLLCWGLPLGVVALCLTLDAIPSVAFSMDYGLKACGWIGNGKANLWTFMVPVAISMAVNLSAFVATVIGIERTTRASSMVSSQRSERKRLLVYVKLSAALGFTWILGLVSAFAPYPWLQWLHLAANSLQGSCLALVYVLNERVVRMLRKKMAAAFKEQFSSAALQTRETSSQTKTTSSSLKV